jgi:hypothetical protein
LVTRLFNTQRVISLQLWHLKDLLRTPGATVTHCLALHSAHLNWNRLLVTRKNFVFGITSPQNLITPGPPSGDRS